jgi:hypothetical protein
VTETLAEIVLLLAVITTMTPPSRKRFLHEEESELNFEINIYDFVCILNLNLNVVGTC